MDLCEAKIETEWFMITKSSYKAAQHIRLLLMMTMTTTAPSSSNQAWYYYGLILASLEWTEFDIKRTEEDKRRSKLIRRGRNNEEEEKSGYPMRPVVPFLPPTSSLCTKFNFCMEDVLIAEIMVGGSAVVDRVIADHRLMVFHTASRNDFCDKWKFEFGEQGERIKQRVEKEIVMTPMHNNNNDSNSSRMTTTTTTYEYTYSVLGPTGTSYVAYLASQNHDNNNKDYQLYTFSDRTVYGARDAFMKTKTTARKTKKDGRGGEEEDLSLNTATVSVTADDSTLPEDDPLSILIELSTTVDAPYTVPCACPYLDTSQEICESVDGCVWRRLFDSCHATTTNNSLCLF